MIQNARNKLVQSCGYFVSYIGELRAQASVYWPGSEPAILVEVRHNGRRSVTCRRTQCTGSYSSVCVVAVSNPVSTIYDSNAMQFCATERTKTTIGPCLAILLKNALCCPSQ